MSSAKKNAKKVKKGKNVKGSGSYLGDLIKQHRGYIPRAIGGALGLMAGKGQKGWDLGADVSRDLLGWGRYRVRGHGAYGVPWSVTNNSLTSEGNIPKVANIVDEGIRICHTEYLGTVTSTTTFSNSVYYLNPGLSATFPWLSKLAANFQQWKIHGCMIVFKSQMTDAVATFSALGSVAIAANMNPAERACANQIEMEQLKFCAVAKPSEHITAPIECGKASTSMNAYFVRTSAVPGNASVMDYDHATIQVATASAPSGGVVLGRLYISYDISLLNPRMVMTGTGCADYRFEGATTANYFGVLATMVKVTDTIGVSFTSPNVSITFPRGAYGAYMIEYSAWGNSTSLTNAYTFSYTNCALSTTIKPFGITLGTPLASYGTTAGVTCVSTHWGLIVEITDNTQIAVVTVTGGTPPSTTVGGHVSIVALPLAPGVAPVMLSSTNPTPGVAVCEDSKESDDDYVDTRVPSAAVAASTLALKKGIKTA